MMNYNKIVLLIILFSFSVSNYAQDSKDHLKPVPGMFGEYDFAFVYHSKIRKVLLKDLSDSPDFRFLTLPSFEPEYVLDLTFERETEKIFLIYRVCKDKIWNNEKWEKIKFKEYRIELDKKKYDLIMSLFNKALLNTKYKNHPSIGFDGTDYYFLVSNNGMKAGKIWSPNKDSKMGKLVDIGNELIKFTKGDTNFNKSLIRKIESLEKEIN